MRDSQRDAYAQDDTLQLATVVFSSGTRHHIYASYQPETVVCRREMVSR